MHILAGLVGIVEDMWEAPSLAFGVVNAPSRICILPFSRWERSGILNHPLTSNCRETAPNVERSPLNLVLPE
jgi:hypothetical protein